MTEFKATDKWYQDAAKDETGHDVIAGLHGEELQAYLDGIVRKWQENLKKYDKYLEKK